MHVLFLYWITAHQCVDTNIMFKLTMSKIERCDTSWGSIDHPKPGDHREYGLVTERVKKMVFTEYIPLNFN